MNIKRLFEKTNIGFKEFVAKVDFANIIGLAEELTKYIKKDSNDYVATINSDLNVDDEIPKITYTYGNGNINNIYLDLASEDGPGLMTSNDKVKLDGFPTLSNSNILTDIGNYERSNSFINLVYKSTSTQTPYPKIKIEAATTTYAGVMTATDKQTLNKVHDITENKAFVSVDSFQNNKLTGVRIDFGANNELDTSSIYINNVTSTVDGCMSHADKVKLDNIQLSFFKDLDEIIDYVKTNNKNISGIYCNNNSEIYIVNLDTYGNMETTTLTNSGFNVDRKHLNFDDNTSSDISSTYLHADTVLLPNNINIVKNDTLYIIDINKGIELGLIKPE